MLALALDRSDSTMAYTSLIDDEPSRVELDDVMKKDDQGILCEDDDEDE